MKRFIVLSQVDGWAYGGEEFDSYEQAETVAIKCAPFNDVVVGVWR